MHVSPITVGMLLIIHDGDSAIEQLSNEKNWCLRLLYAVMENRHLTQIISTFLINLSVGLMELNSFRGQ
jgi:hypothetical protein